MNKQRNLILTGILAGGAALAAGWMLVDLGKEPPKAVAAAAPHSPRPASQGTQPPISDTPANSTMVSSSAETNLITSPVHSASSPVTPATTFVAIHKPTATLHNAQNISSGSKISLESPETSASPTASLSALPATAGGTVFTGGSAPSTAPVNETVNGSPLAIPPSESANPAASVTQAAAVSNSSDAVTRTLVTDNAQVELGPGIPVPVALLEPDRPMTPQIESAFQAIRTRFKKDLANLPTANAQSSSEGQVGASTSSPMDASAAASAAYFDAVNRANEQYRALFGDAAYNQALLRTARENLQSLGQQK